MNQNNINISKDLCDNSIQKRKIYGILIIFLIILPIVLYSVRIFFAHSEFINYNDDNDITSLHPTSSYISSIEPNKNYYFDETDEFYVGYNENSIYMMYIILNTFESNKKEVYSIYNSSISIFMNISTSFPSNILLSFELWKFDSEYETISWNNIKPLELIDVFSFVYFEQENITLIFEGEELSKNIINHTHYFIKMSYINLIELGESIFNEGDFDLFILSSDLYHTNISLNYYYLPNYYYYVINIVLYISVILISLLLYFTYKNYKYINYCNV